MRLLHTGILTLVVAAPASGQSLCGVWRPVEVVIGQGTSVDRHTTDIQPGLMIFTKTHYSGMQVRGFEPRPQLSAQPTDEERGRVFTPFTANAGTYQLRDSILAMTPSVSKNPALMSGQPSFDRVRVLADSLWFISASGDRRTKWLRIEHVCGS